MADHAAGGAVELGGKMDYAEHERTYAGFLALAKYGTLALVALMLAMAFGFFVGGAISGAIVFLLVFVAGVVALR